MKESLERKYWRSRKKSRGECSTAALQPRPGPSSLPELNAGFSKDFTSDLQGFNYNPPFAQGSLICLQICRRNSLLLDLPPSSQWAEVHQAQKQEDINKALKRTILLTKENKEWTFNFFQKSKMHLSEKATLRNKGAKKIGTDSSTFFLQVFFPFYKMGHGDVIIISMLALWQKGFWFSTSFIPASANYFFQDTSRFLNWSGTELIWD